MGNIVPRAGIEPTSLGFRTSVLTIKPPRVPNVSIISTPICPCGSLPERSAQTITLVLLNCKSVNAYNYVHT